MLSIGECTPGPVCPHIIVHDHNVDEIWGYPSGSVFEWMVILHPHVVHTLHGNPEAVLARTVSISTAFGNTCNTRATKELSTMPSELQIRDFMQTSASSFTLTFDLSQIKEEGSRTLGQCYDPGWSCDLCWLCEYCIGDFEDLLGPVQRCYQLQVGQYPPQEMLYRRNLVSLITCKGYGP